MVNVLEYAKAALRNTVVRARLQKKYPTCRIFPGATMDKQSTLGKHNVLFEDVTVLKSVIGDHTYIQKNSIVSDAEVGKFCSIAMGVSVGLPQHSISMVSSHPAFYLKHTPLAKTYSDQDVFIASQKTIIGHDVWIGQNSIIMNGLRVGSGAVIGAGSVVTRDVPPYAVIGGAPARIIKFRFEEKIRHDLLGCMWWDMPEKWLEKNYSLFQHPEKLLDVLRNKTLNT